MPTVDDLRAALRDRESFAGDPDAVLSALDQRRRGNPRRGRGRALAGPAPSPRRHVLAWACSAAIVAALGVGAAVAVGTSHGTSRPDVHPDAAATSPQLSDQAAATTATTAPPALAVPADALRWSFTIDPVPGYTVDYESYTLDQQNATLSSNSDPAFSAGVSVYGKGQFDPRHGGVDATAISGQQVQVNGHPAVFEAGPSTPTLFWSYASDSWASVGVSGVPGTQTGDGSTTTTGANTALHEALTIADAVRIGSAGPILLPFQLENVPAPLMPVMISNSLERPDLLYGTSANPEDFYFGVARWSAEQYYAATHNRQLPPGTPNSQRSQLEAKAAWAAYTAARSSGDWAVHALPDGGALLLTVERGHEKDLPQSQLQQIATTARVSASLTDTSTWLPVVP